MSIRRLASAIVVVMLMLAGLAACGDDSSADSKDPSAPASGPQPPVVAEATLRLGKPIPAPTGPVVLVIKNAGNPNRGKDLALDLDQLEGMGVVSLKIDDEVATKKKSVFTGPLLRTVLAYAEVTGDTIHALALNDYKVDIPVSDTINYPTMLATRQDGEHMTVANFGPSRVIYPQKGYDLDSPTIAYRLIWQLSEISVS